ncbi:MAG: DUF7544 domain-containing protein [Halanaeroarchaeum sp.]
MALHAVQNVDDAFDATREFLFPFDLRRWVKLAVVAIFLGSGTNVPTTNVDTSSSSGRLPDGGVSVAPPENLLLVVGALVVAGVLLLLAWGLLGAIFEFVFVESLRSGDVRLRLYWADRWRQGVRLFGFRIAIALPMIALFVGWLALILGPLLLGVGNLALPLVAILVGIPLAFVLSLVYGLVYGFTTVFVVPIMILDECGVLAGWRTLWSSIVDDWTQYLAYAVASVLLTVALGILSSILVGIAAVIVLLPFALVALLVHLAVSLSSTVGLAVLVVLGVVFLAVMLLVWAFVQVPILTYLRYYALLVLGDVDESLDLIPGRRRAIRSGR